MATQNLTEIFNKMKQENGKINKSEFKKFFLKIGYRLQRIEELWLAGDVNKDGFIDFNEWEDKFELVLDLEEK
jgi:Ca2+-binding EF-hand superfamily protein